MLRSALFGAAILAALAAAGSTARAERPPNIVLIVSDDQGYGDLEISDDYLIAPHLARLADEGVRLTSYYVTAAACTPSRGSLLTGRYPQRHGTFELFRNHRVDMGYEYDEFEYSTSHERILGMDTREILLPTLLKDAGYTSAIYGKWDLGQFRRFLPLQRGFDDFYGFVNTGIDFFTHKRYGVHSMVHKNEPSRKDQGTYCDEIFTREALRFIERNQDRPFFLYVPYFAPHVASSLDPAIRGAPQAPERFVQMYLEKYPDLDDNLVEGQRYGEPAMVPSRQRRRLLHLASLTAMDDGIGQILAALDERGLAENTLVVFFSDNGGTGTANNGPLRGGKGNLFEGGIRVPLIARWPNRLPAGTVNDELVTALELFPTFLRAAGVEPPAHLVLDGHDVTDVLAGEAASPREEMFWDFRGQWAVRAGPWKLLGGRRGSGLFNLAEDIGETEDLSERHPEVVEDLTARLAGWRRAMEQAEPRGPFRDF